MDTWGIAFLGGRVETFKFDKILFGNDDKKAEKTVSNHRPVIATQDGPAGRRTINKGPPTGGTG